MNYYIVDRFEGDFAVCEAPGGEMENLRRELLPPDTGEGDLIYLQSGVWAVDQEATKTRRAAMAAKRAGLKRKQAGK